MTGILCTWCGTETAEEFCSEACRASFNAACGIWAAQEYAAERVSIFELRTALYQRARSLGRDLAPGDTQAPETEKRSDGALRTAAPMADVR